jgi:Rieske Fe-S protein
VRPEREAGADGEAGDPCAGCAASSSRREFLRETTATAISLLIGLGVAPASARALPVSSLRGSKSRGGEVRYPIPASDGVTIDKPNEVVLVRWEGNVYAFALSCPHQRTMLRWIEKDGRFQCPKHKSKYEPDGSFISGRATRGMDRYRLRVEGSAIVVNTSATIRIDENAAAWTKASAKIG